MARYDTGGEGMTFSMIHLEVSKRSLVFWARQSKFSLADRDYLIHAAMRFSFGSKAPQPFEVFDNGGKTLKVLGYADCPGAELVEEMGLAAEPMLHEVIPPNAVRSKDMPSSWPEGKSFGFRVRFCPISRRSGEGDKIVERDAFLAACERTPDDHVDREMVYAEWLAERFKAFDGAQILDMRMKSFRLKEFCRKDKGRSLRKLTRPETIFDGVLIVTNSSKFSLMLREGVGRHKAFGFGAILLRTEGC
jgi:CRISPR system Cascade subunit CasE